MSDDFDVSDFEHSTLPPDLSAMVLRTLDGIHTNIPSKRIADFIDDTLDDEERARLKAAFAVPIEYIVDSVLDSPELITFLGELIRNIKWQAT